MSPRSKTQLIVVSLLILFGFCLPLMAEPELHFDGQVRAHAEVDKKTFVPDSYAPEQDYLRTRLGVSAIIDSNATIYIQIQDSRILGDKNQLNRLQSGTEYDGKNVDMHQAYIEIDHLWKGGIGLKAGRFELNYGNQRVFGSDDWDNAGRSWEGILLRFKRPAYKINLFSLIRYARDSYDYDRDFSIVGIYTHLKNLNLDVFGFLENDANRTYYYDAHEYVGNVDALTRYNVGMYLDNKNGNFDYNVNAVYQFGTFNAAYTIDNFPRKADISAYLITAEVGYNISGMQKVRFSLGFDYSSGDNDADNTYERYENSYYSNHRFRGFMDYFILSYPNGLVDSYFHGEIAPLTGWVVQSDLHYFRTDKEFVYLGKVTNDLGLEFDLTVTTTRITGVTLDAGASIFLPTDEYAGSTAHDPGYWLYSMITADFKK